MMITRILRYLLGLVLVFSAFVKLNDPLGFAYKLEEYFSADVLNMEYFIPYALAISIFVSFVEMLIALSLLTRVKYVYSLRLSIAMFVFFGFLTFYSAYFNKVSDCGCFGDAIKFTPWQSFAKDLVMLMMAMFLLFKSNQSDNNTQRQNKFLILAVISLIIPFYSLLNIPFVDFRPYRIGVDIKKEMSIPEDAPMDQYKDTWIYKVNGEVKEFDSSEEPWNIPGAEFVDRKSELISKGFQPKIHDFALYLNNSDVTEDILNMDDVYLIFSTSLSKINSGKLKRLSNLINTSVCYIVTSSSEEEIKDFSKDISDEEIILTTDATTCKTVIRSNPGVLRLKNGVIIEKFAL